MRAGSALGDAIAGHRTLGREDRAVLGTVSIVLILAAVLSAIFPWIVGWAFALLLGWLGAVVSVRALVQIRRGRREEAMLKSMESHGLAAEEHPLVAEGHDRYHPDDAAAGVEEATSTEAR